MQKPEALPGIAWCSPPQKLTPCCGRALPDRAGHVDGALDDPRAGLVHAEEGRVVVGAEPAAGSATAGSADAAFTAAT